MPMRLRPDETVTPEDLARGERALVKDAAWATTAGALYGGVILVGFALELGAPPVIIGLLAAIPFLAQISQLAAIALIERVRQRRKIVLLAVTVARTLILSLALVAFAEGQLLQLSLLVVVQAAISLSGAIAGCAFNGWVHEVVPRETLGTLFSRRLFWSTVLSSLGALSAAYLVQVWPLEDRLQAYAIAFVAAGAAGFMSSHYLLRVPEPPMRRTGPPLPLTELLRAPLVDANFRKVVAFMAAWNLASNVAAPFITVYLVQQNRLRARHSHDDLGRRADRHRAHHRLVGAAVRPALEQGYSQRRVARVLRLAHRARLHRASRAPRFHAAAALPHPGRHGGGQWRHRPCHRQPWP